MCLSLYIQPAPNLLWGSFVQMDCFSCVYCGGKDKKTSPLIKVLVDYP